MRAHMQATSVMSHNEHVAALPAGRLEPDSQGGQDVNEILQMPLVADPGDLCD
jgi:hypothetical protein